MKNILLFVLIFFVLRAQAQINLDINAHMPQHDISPYIYGRNNNFSDVFGSTTSPSEFDLYKQAGLRFARENSGNNATKYNWRLKISSHPDWYNNVYDHDWDYASQTILENMPNLQVMWAFQLIGKVASNKNNNFGDWNYNNSQWWSGVAQNLAGGGVVNPSGGSDALVEGNPDLYLMDWPADSTVEILNHWFGEKGKGFTENNFLYWSMDNEPEIWSGTHNDVMPIQISANEFMERYFEVAKKARELFPDIKLTGPICANEWQWYKYADESLRIDGKYYSWIEYFIKRVADEQKSSGVRLLDVLDIHWYPYESETADVLQSHRVFFDQEYEYPGANGVKTIHGGWNNSLKNEYIFQRINDWLDLHFGQGHGITLGLTETEINHDDPNVVSVVYASMLGTFANNGVEIFSPWTWKTGMWETLHLYSRYAQNMSVESISSNESIVSGYTSINDDADSMTIILVNRDLNIPQNVSVNIEGFTIDEGVYQVMSLYNLPETETFKSHTNNALVNTTVNISNNAFTVELPPLSTNAVLLKSASTAVYQKHNSKTQFEIYPNPASESVRLVCANGNQINSLIEIFDIAGKKVKQSFWDSPGVYPLIIDIHSMQQGAYFIKMSNSEFTSVKKLIVR